MRLPPLSRLYTTAALTRVRRVLVPLETPSQDHEHRPFEPLPEAQMPSPFLPKPSVIDRGSSSHQQPEISTLFLEPNPKPATCFYPPLHTVLTDALEYFRAPSGPLSESKIESLLPLANDERTNYCIVTIQHLLRGTPKLDPILKCLLWSNFKWNQVSERLASNGFGADDISHWAWILLETQPDKRVARFLSRPRHKPLFILVYILRDNFSNPESLTRLLEYCIEWYSGQETVDETGEYSKALSAMTPSMIPKIISGLCRQARLVQPDAVPDIANLAGSYIQAIPRSHRHFQKAYSSQCRVFNAAIKAVSQLSEASPYEHSSYNWIAIRTLLSMSTNLNQALIIGGESYRAIRHVLLALPKTDSERDTASTLSSSWPPYRVLRDGMEEKADTEDFLGRAVKVGFMMQEGGYAKTETDLIMDILGGMAPDGSPTIQTRANYPPHLNVPQGIWAALIRTTRNAQEAWALFKHPPEPGAKPTSEVYLELMQKIAAKPADPAHHNLPGDGREVFPFDETNLSDYEKARLLPPSIPELIEEMFNTGVVIEGRMLAWLMSHHSDSFETALQYIDHSDLNEEAKKELRWSITDCQKPTLGSPDRPLMSKNLSSDFLRAIVALACRLQPCHTADSPHFTPPSRNIHSIHHAIWLVRAAWSSEHVSNPGAGSWELIMRALSKPNIVVSPRDNSFERVRLAFKVLENAEAQGALNFGLFCSFAHVIRNAVWTKLPFLMDPSVTIKVGDPEFMSLYKARSPQFMIPQGLNVFRKSDSADDVAVDSWHEILTPIFKNSQSGVAKHRTHYEIVREASTKLKALWRTLATRGPANQACANRGVTATHINSYMRTLATAGDVEEMVLLLCWVVRDWAPIAGRFLSTRSRQRVHGALCAFRAFAEPLLDESTVVSLQQEAEKHLREGGRIHWPDLQDTEAYVTKNDVWGNHPNLHEVIQRASPRQRGQLPGDEIERRIRSKLLK